MGAVMSLGGHFRPVLLALVRRADERKGRGQDVHREVSEDATAIQILSLTPLHHFKSFSDGSLFASRVQSGPLLITRLMLSLLDLCVPDPSTQVHAAHTRGECGSAVTTPFHWGWH